MRCTPPMRECPLKREYALVQVSGHSPWVLDFRMTAYCTLPAIKRHSLSEKIGLLNGRYLLPKETFIAVGAGTVDRLKVPFGYR